MCHGTYPAPGVSEKAHSSAPMQGQGHGGHWRKGQEGSQSHSAPSALGHKQTMGLHTFPALTLFRRILKIELLFQSHLTFQPKFPRIGLDSKQCSPGSLGPGTCHCEPAQPQKGHRDLLLFPCSSEPQLWLFPSPVTNSGASNGRHNKGRSGPRLSAEAK